MKRVQYRVYIPALDRHGQPLFNKHPEILEQFECAQNVATEMSKIARGANVTYVEAGIWHDETGNIHTQPCYIAYCNYDKGDREAKLKLDALVRKLRIQLNQTWMAVERIPIQFDLIGD
jgi:hypothetical protein